jgi:transcription antitermination protein NusB
VISVQALYAWDVAGTPVEQATAFGWMEDEIPAEVEAFAVLLVTGVIENRERIDRAIQDTLEHWDFSRIAGVERAILRMSVYTLLFQKDIPVGVAIDEAVDIAKEFCADESYRFINGVLDAVRREAGL